jgi:hypothetical protein
MGIYLPSRDKWVAEGRRCSSTPKFWSGVYSAESDESAWPLGLTLWRRRSTGGGCQVRVGWSAERGYDGPAVPVWVKRMAPPDSETSARSKIAVDWLIARREVHLREKTLWRMLCETCARAGEILGINIEELDLAGRRAPVRAKGAAVRRRAAGRGRTSCWR